MTDLVARLVRWAETRERRIVLALCALILIAGVPYSFALGDDLPYIDERDYWAIANNIVSRQSFSSDGVNPTAWRAPVPPFLVAAVIALGGGAPHVRILNFLALSVTLYALYLLARQLGGSLAGVLAALLVLGYPVLFYTAGTLFPQSMGTCLFALVLLLLSRAETLPIRWLLVLGGLYALLILTVPTFVVYLAFALAWIWLRRREARVPASAAVLAPVIVLVGAWTIRNYLIFHTFFFVTTNAGLPLLVGNAPETMVTAGGNIDLSAYEPIIENMGEAQADAYFKDRAVQYILENKGEAAWLYVRKVANYFNFRNDLGPASESSPLRDAAMLLTYGPLLALFVARLVLHRRLPVTRFEWLLAAIYLSIAFYAAIFFTRIRYRLPFDIIPIVIAALFLAAWARHSLTSRAVPAPLAAAP